MAKFVNADGSAMSSTVLHTIDSAGNPVPVSAANPIPTGDVAAWSSSKQTAGLTSATAGVWTVAAEESATRGGFLFVNTSDDTLLLFFGLDENPPIAAGIPVLNGQTWSGKIGGLAINDGVQVACATAASAPYVIVVFDTGRAP